MSYYLPHGYELDDAYEDGYYDFINGYSLYENPFYDWDLAYEWEEGWLDARSNYRDRY